MRAGKLPLELLSELLEGVKADDPRVVLGPRPGEDAALIDMGDRYLVAKSDPITFATELIGWYLVQVNSNDLAVMGATPLWLLATILLPEGTRPDAVRAVFEQLQEACAALGVSLVGGHTEVTYGLPRPLAVGALLGEVSKEEVVLTSGARPGDAVVLTKGVAIEGTAILAREAREELLEAGLDAGTVDRASRLLFDPGISVVGDAAAARGAARRALDARPDGGRAGDGAAGGVRGGGGGRRRGRRRSAGVAGERGRLPRAGARSTGTDRLGRAARDRLAGAGADAGRRAGEAGDSRGGDWVGDRAGGGAASQDRLRRP